MCHATNLLQRLINIILLEEKKRNLLSNAHMRLKLCLID